MAEEEPRMDTQIIFPSLLTLHDRVRCHTDIVYGG